ncbi:MAG TPA: hypothetical protein VM364_22300 [Vicinamibacterales bacterium]|nr:hypothetical protein [Vicinamibacterales bacterium]
MKPWPFAAALVLLLSASGSGMQEAGRITRIEFRPATAQEGGGVLITLVGSGSCTYTMDFGDGTSERRTAMLPDRLQHTYGADGEYLVVATPDAPCEGVARAKLDVRAIERGIWGLAAEPGTAAPDGTDVTITINGRGDCAVSLDFGDGMTEKVEGTLPAQRTHRYAKTGKYELRAVAAAPCRGEAALTLEISRTAAGQSR